MYKKRSVLILCYFKDVYEYFTASLVLFSNLFVLDILIFFKLRISDHLCGLVVSTSDCYIRGPEFDSRPYPRNFSGSIGCGTGSTQPREDNWVAI